MAAMPPRWTISPQAFRRIAGAVVVALVLTIISGAAVRLTGSGLGCPDWPNCTRASVVAPLQSHAWIEFGNRLVNAAVTIAAIGVLVAALRRFPRRRDLTLLSVGVLAGLVAEVVLGAVVVYTKLDPVVVTIHFLLGLVFLAVAVVLLERAGRADDAPPVPERLVGRPVIGLARLGLLALAIVVTLGTIVTSTGPHAGAPDTPRYHLSLHAVAQVHGTAVETYLALTLLMLALLVRSRAPAAVVRRAEMLLVAVVAQAAVGYTQYLSEDPVGLVALHVAGAAILVVAELRFYFGLWTRLPVGSEAAPAAELVTA
jgi:heme a synthase